MGTISPLHGRRFGKLSVTRFFGLGATNKKAIWVCKCDCGQNIRVYSYHLTAGTTTHCGCERNHGPRLSPLRMFRAGLDTVEIAKRLGITEAEAYKRLIKAREAAYERSPPSAPRSSLIKAGAQT